MEKALACREIISQIKETPSEKRNVRRIIAQISKKYHLSSIPKHSEIISHADEKDRELIRSLLLVKPTRTLSGVAPIAVMTSPAPCPHGICLACPGGPEHEYASPQSYTGEEPAALRARMHEYSPYNQVFARLLQFEQLGHNVDKSELIVMGGTITSRDPEYQKWFVSECLRAMNNYDSNTQSNTQSDAQPSFIEEGELTFEELCTQNESAKVRCIAITFETRPDWCTRKHIEAMLELGVTKVELGVQHLDDAVLVENRRGCTVADTISANTALRDAGLKVGFHMMPNMPGSTIERDRWMFEELFSSPDFKPDFLKIYPTLVTAGTGIETLYRNGQYATYAEDDLVDLVADAKAAIPPYCRLQRIQRDIPAKMIISGSKHANFRQLAQKRLEETNRHCQCIRCSEIGRYKGEKRSESGGNGGNEDVQYHTLTYACCGGKEYFISARQGKALLGFVRLRVSGDPWLLECSHSAFIRELHVYGALVPIGKDAGQGEQQHRKYGQELVKRAEEAAALEGCTKICVMAGIGVRPYYKRLSYVRTGAHMCKELTAPPRQQ